MRGHLPFVNDVLRRCSTVLAAVALSVAATSAGAESYVLARAPQSTAIKLVDDWTPFLDRLSRDAGVTITLKVYESRQTFEGDLFGGAPDFAFMNPYYAVLAKKRLGYVALVRDSAKPLSGIIVVRKDSAIATVQDLEGKTIAFPDPNAMGASLYPRAILVGDLGLSFQTQYVGAHENVYRAVFRRQADAGGGVNSTLASEPEELRSQLKVIWKTPDLAPHPLIAHPRIPESIREKVKMAILNMANDADGQALLESVKLTKPVEVDFTRDYGHIEELGLEKYTVDMGR